LNKTLTQVLGLGLRFYSYVSGSLQSQKYLNIDDPFARVSFIPKPLTAQRAVNSGCINSE